MKTFKRIISAMLCLCLLTGAFIIPSSAAKVSYSGSVDYMNSKFGKNLLNYELTHDQKTDVINLALSQLGYKEGWLAGSGTSETKQINLTEYNRWFYGENKPDPWCAIWVSFILRHAGVSKDVIPNFSACSEAASNLSKGIWGKDRGVWHDAYLNGKSNYTPQKGDIVFFSWQADFVPHRYYVKGVDNKKIGQVNHTAIVLEDAKSPNDYVKCIEGNSSDSVCIVNQNPRKIVGYFTPAYTTKEETGLGTVKITAPGNINNAWISTDNQNFIKWEKYPGADYYEYTIREERCINGEYKVTDNWLCNNVKTQSQQIDLSKFNLPDASAWKCWVGAYSKDGKILAENFVYLRLYSDKTEPDNSTESDKPLTGGGLGGITDIIPEEKPSVPNTSDEGYGTGYVDPLPDNSYQTEAGGTSTKPQPSEGVEVPSNPDNNPVSDSSDITYDSEVSPDYETPEDCGDNNSAEDKETVSLLKKILAMLETLFRFFGIAF